MRVLTSICFLIKLKLTTLIVKLIILNTVKSNYCHFPFHLPVLSGLCIPLWYLSLVRTKLFYLSNRVFILNSLLWGDLFVPIFCWAYPFWVYPWAACSVNLCLYGVLPNLSGTLALPESLARLTLNFQSENLIQFNYQKINFRSSL